MNTLKTMQDRVVSLFKKKVTHRFFFTMHLAISLFLLSEPLSALPALADSREFKITKPSKVLPAPDFSLKTPEGIGISLRQQKGKVVLLNFWATWCRPCAAEMPSLNRLSKRFKDKGLSVLAISADRGNTDNVKRFLKKHALTFPVGLDADGLVRNKYEVDALPFSYIIDREGRFLGRIVGEVDWDTPGVQRFFTDLLTDSPKR